MRRGVFKITQPLLGNAKSLAAVLDADEVAPIHHRGNADRARTHARIADRIASIGHGLDDR